MKTTFDEFWEDVCTYKLNSIYKHYELKIAFKYANGCGAKGGVKFPDTIWFVSIVAACIIHDIEWKLAKNYQDLVGANERFDNNLKRITDYESMSNLTTWARRQRLAKYVNGVEIHGTHAYALDRGFEYVSPKASIGFFKSIINFIKW